MLIRREGRPGAVHGTGDSSDSIEGIGGNDSPRRGTGQSPEKATFLTRAGRARTFRPAALRLGRRQRREAGLVISLSIEYEMFNAV